MTYGGIQSRGDLGFDILGDTWLKGIYAVGFRSMAACFDTNTGFQIFDQGNKRFGAVVRVDLTQDPSVPE